MTAAQPSARLAAMLAYLQSFWRANWKPILTFGLSVADGVMLLKHPELKPYEGIFGGALLTFGIHLQPVVYSPAALAARLESVKAP